MTDAAPGNAWEEAVIERITAETPTVKTFALRRARATTFLAGQHVDVRLTAPDGYAAQRSYSITSAPDHHDTIEIAVERLRDGEVSPWFHDVANVGDSIEIRGPFTHHFVWRPALDGSALLVGGGSGVAPLMSMIRHRANVTGAAPVTLLYSARTWNDVIFREELLRHEMLQRDIQLRVAITRGSLSDGTAARGADYVRRVDDAMLHDVVRAMPVPPALCFVCGNNGFVGAVADALVAIGIDPLNIRTERYGE